MLTTNAHSLISAEKNKQKSPDVGHTRITHSYILKNEQAPFCIPCNELFTVKHFLIT